MAISGVGPVTLAAITAATTTGGTVLSATQILCATLIITADAGNSGSIYVGDANVSTTRYTAKLAANASISVPMISPSRPGASNLDLSKFYVLGSAASQKVQVTYFERLGG